MWKSCFYNASAYNDRYRNIAKFIITTGGDEFFQPDDAHYYFDQLEGPKYLRCNYGLLRKSNMHATSILVYACLQEDVRD